MNNRLFDDIIKSRNGHYCHDIEVNDKYELESFLDSFIDEFKDKYSNKNIKDFLMSLSIHSLSDKNEEEIYSFSIYEYIKDTIYSDILHCRLVR